MVCILTRASVSSGRTYDLLMWVGLWGQVTPMTPVTHPKNGPADALHMGKFIFLHVCDNENVKTSSSS